MTRVRRMKRWKMLMSIYIEDITWPYAIFYPNIRIVVRLSVLTCRICCIQCYDVGHCFCSPRWREIQQSSSMDNN